MTQQEIINALTDFIAKSLSSTKTFSQKDGQTFNLNKAIYEIQRHLSTELTKHNVNTRLNDAITSDSILQSFTKFSPAHPKEDYTFPFLIFLSENFKKTKDLLHYIQQFIDSNAAHLTWQDIVITKTGATRCNTNVRFALNMLRDMGLVRGLDQNGKRTLLPTLLGQLLVFYLKWKDKNKETLDPISYAAYQDCLQRLAALKEPEIMVEFLAYMKSDVKVDDNTNQVVTKYLKRFIEIILPAIQVTHEGIKYVPKYIDKKERDALISEMIHEKLSLIPMH